MAEKIDTLDSISVKVAEELSNEEIKRQEFLNSIEVVNAYYISPENTKSFILEYLTDSEDEENRKLNREIVRTDVPSDLYNKAIELYTLDGIMRNTYQRFEAASNFAKDLEDYLKHKNNNEDEIGKSFNLKSLEELSTEDLFKLKLEIFEKEEVQNSENRELRSAIRKSKNAIELIYNYYLIIKDEE